VRSAAGKDATAQDSAVLDVVFQDLLNRPGVVAVPNGEAKQMRVSIESPHSEQAQVRTADVLAAFPKKTMFGAPPKGALVELSEPQFKLVQEAAEDLARRATTKDGINAFVPKDKRIGIYTAKEAKAYRPKNFLDRGPQVFYACPPGYSRDRQLACVEIGFGWSIHGATARYVVVKDRDRWIVLRASVIFFM
jgi:hypothetical protein